MESGATLTDTEVDFSAWLALPLDALALVKLELLQKTRNAFIIGASCPQPGANEKLF